ncbi:MAG TPA: hypothetical protein VNL72_01920 [Gammaproteobacteria bacterium]|nr:hypothetical protein [Gammaproteobacteria bacterium]
MRSSPLRDLARQYAKGKLSFEDYRRKRSELLQAIQSGRTRIEYREIALTPTLDTVTLEVSTVKTKQRLWLVGGVTAVVLTLASVTVFLWPGRSPVPAQQATAAAVDPAQRLLQEFVRAGDYSVTALASFEDAWIALAPEERARARENVWFKRLKSDLGSRIREQEELAAIEESGQAAFEAERLRAFALRLEESGNADAPAEEAGSSE